jgi:hypothetical protein
VTAPTPDDEAAGMCPNCVTPWKCNGPHEPATAPAPATPATTGFPAPGERTDLRRISRDARWDDDRLGWMKRLEFLIEELAPLVAAREAAAYARGRDEEIRCTCLGEWDTRCRLHGHPAMRAMRAEVAAAERARKQHADLLAILADEWADDPAGARDWARAYRAARAAAAAPDTTPEGEQR